MHLYIYKIFTRMYNRQGIFFSDLQLNEQANTKPARLKMHALYHLLMCEVFQNNGSSAVFCFLSREVAYICCRFLAAEQKSIPPFEGPRFRIHLVNQQQFFSLRQSRYIFRFVFALFYFST